MTTSRERTAWLITWQGVGQHVEVDQPIAGILPPQSGPDTVRVLVERLYASHTYTGAEMLQTLSPNGHNPYSASFGTVVVVDGDHEDQVPYTGQMFCGHNPQLYARRVTRLRVAAGTYRDGSPRLAWTEPPHPGRLRMPNVLHTAPLEPPARLTHCVALKGQTVDVVAESRGVTRD